MKDEAEPEFVLTDSSFILHPSSSVRSLFDFQQQLVHAFAFFLNAVPHEMNLWCARQIEGEAQLIANVGSSVTQRIEREAVFLFSSSHRHKNLGVPAIVRNANVGHGYHCKPRVFQFVSDNLGNLLTQNVCNSLGAMHGFKNSFKFQVSSSKFGST